MSRSFITGETKKPDEYPGDDNQMSEKQIISSNKNITPPSRTGVPKMFDRIAHRYDLLNHLLSGNLDKSWRKKVATLLPNKKNLDVLDIATGTADQLIALYATGKVISGIGIDLSQEMLTIGKEKIEKLNLTDSLTLQTGDAEKIPFNEQTFDSITISFGIRNVTDVSNALRDMKRVLKPGGRLLILEFSLPSNRLIRAGHLFYLRHLLPQLGELISGDSAAYRYLNETIETFPYGKKLCNLLENSGFTSVCHYPLTLGIVTIYKGDA